MCQNPFNRNTYLSLNTNLYIVVSFYIIMNCTIQICQLETRTEAGHEYFGLVWFNPL